MQRRAGAPVGAGQPVDGRLRRGHPRDRHAVGRARHVVEARHLRRRRSTRGRRRARRRRRASGRASPRGRPTPPGARASRRPAGRSSRTATGRRPCARCSLLRNDPSTSSREKPSAVCVRSFVPNEKKSAHLGDPVGDEARARQLDHRADGAARCRSRRGPRSSHDAVDHLAHQLELLLVGDQRDHDLELRRCAGALADGPRGAHDRLHLHLVDLGVQDPEPDAARAEHRVGLRQAVHPLERASRAPPGRACARCAPARRPGRSPRRRAGTRGAAGRAAGS